MMCGSRTAPRPAYRSNSASKCEKTPDLLTPGPFVRSGVYGFGYAEQVYKGSRRRPKQSCLRAVGVDMVPVLRDDIVDLFDRKPCP